MDTLTWLQHWYLSQCDEDWEHTYEIRIGNVDNPGWWIEIPLAETELEHRTFAAIHELRTESDWLICRVDVDVFKGYGGPLNLSEILQVFRTWAENATESAA